MKIYVVRHGQTDWNALKILQGQKDCVLNENGREQASNTAKLLEDKGIDIIVSSSLKRARETAEIISQIIGVPVVEDSRLIERCFGKSEGLTKDEIKLINASNPITEHIWNYSMNIDFNEIERMRDFCKRVYDSLDEITKKYSDKTILIVTHGGVTIPMHCYLTNFPLEEIDTIDGIIKLSNGEIAEYDV